MLFSLHTSQKIFLIKNPVVETVETGAMKKSHSGLHCTVTPVLPGNTSVFERKYILLNLIRDLIAEEKITNYSITTGTCRAVPYLRYLAPEEIVYFQNNLEAITNPELFIEMNEYADAEEEEFLFHPSLVRLEKRGDSGEMFSRG